MRMIGIICPSRQMFRVAQSLARTYSKPSVMAVEACLDEAIRSAQLLSQAGAEGIVTLPRTASAVREVTGLPVAEVEPTVDEIVEALSKATKWEIKKVGFIGFPGKRIRRALPLAGRLLSVEVKELFYATREQMAESIDKAREEGLSLVLTTGNCVAALARSRGLCAKVLPVSYAAMMEALVSLEARGSVEGVSEGISVVGDLLDAEKRGIAIIGCDGRIWGVNQLAEEVLKVSRTDVLGKTVAETKSQLLRELVSLDDGSRLGDWRISKKQLRHNILGYYTVFTLHGKDDGLHKVKAYDSESGARFSFSDIITNDSKMRQVIARAQNYARSDYTVLITGESGTGKDLLAQSIHNMSLRASGPFIPLNCAALPESLLESELFGYEPGAFTGGRREGKAGLFEVASGGTVFLDEIGDLPLALQTKLLRVIETKEVRRLGGSKVIRFDTRILAATNQNLEAAVKEGKFRADLYFRLNILRLHIPPLRERPGDIPLLAEYFINRVQLLSGRRVPRLSNETLKILVAYDWPGNVRELENVITRYVLSWQDDLTDQVLMFKQMLSEGNRLREQADSPTSSPKGANVNIELGTLKDMESRIIKSLHNKGMTQCEIARLLGISRTTLWKRLKRLQA